VIAGAIALAAAGAALIVAGKAAGESRLDGLLAAPSRARGRRLGRPPLLATAGVLAVLLRWGILLTCTAMAASAGVYVVRRRAAESRNLAANGAAVPVLCRVVAAELGAGAAPVHALSVAAKSAPSEVSAVLREAAAAERLGIGAAGPLGRGPSGAESLRFVSICWAVSSRTGSRLGPALERVGSALQSELDSAAAIDAELVGPRLSARVMAGLPAFGVLLGLALGTDPIGFLFGTSLGGACLVTAVALDALGLVWISRLASRAAR
jgi:tight adherence protein B